MRRAPAAPAWWSRSGAPRIAPRSLRPGAPPPPRRPCARRAPRSAGGGPASLRPSVSAAGAGRPGGKVWTARSRALRPLAQSGVLQASRVQLIRGLVRTMTTPISPPTDPTSLPRVSSPAGRASPAANRYALATHIPARRVLLANLDITSGLRPALVVGLAALGAAALPALRRLAAATARRPAAFSR